VRIINAIISTLGVSSDNSGGVHMVVVGLLLLSSDTAGERVL
jgi:hypothetical protein